MSEESKKHIYPYSLRLAAMAGNTFCQDKAILYIVPPAQALTIENLFCHFNLTFDVGVAAADRVVQYIGVCNEIPILVNGEPSYLRKYDINQAADVNRQVDIKVDLSALLNRDHANYREYFDDPTTDDFTYCIIKLADGCRGNNNVGTVNIWKLDALYTTTGIR